MLECVVESEVIFGEVEYDVLDAFSNAVYTEVEFDFEMEDFEAEALTKRCEDGLVELA